MLTNYFFTTNMRTFATIIQKIVKTETSDQLNESSFFQRYLFGVFFSIFFSSKRCVLSW